MADYNVQMKQYNGTSFDNILPYASQALTLAGGGGATEIIAQARAGLSQIATGSYVGNGKHGKSNPTVITCGFKPKIVFFMSTKNPNNTSYNSPYGATFIGWVYGVARTQMSTSSGMDYVYFTATNTGLSFYTDTSNSPAAKQNNDSNTTYYFVAIG